MQIYKKIQINKDRSDCKYRPDCLNQICKKKHQQIMPCWNCKKYIKNPKVDHDIEFSDICIDIRYHNVDNYNINQLTL